jgi:hypothetical protein
MVEFSKSTRFIGMIAAGLLIWASVLAWGVIRNQPVLDLRKPLIIVGVVLLFLGGWVVLLLTRKSNSK